MFPVWGMVIVVKGVVMADFHTRVSVDLCFRPLKDFYHVCVCILYYIYYICLNQNNSTIEFTLQ